MMRMPIDSTHGIEYCQYVINETEVPTMAKASLLTPEMLAAYLSKRDPKTGLFRKAPTIAVIKGKSKPPKVPGIRSGNHRVTRVRHDLRKYLESTRAA